MAFAAAQVACKGYFWESFHQLSQLKNQK